jgi:hypothetical protein
VDDEAENSGIDALSKDSPHTFKVQRSDGSTYRMATFLPVPGNKDGPHTFRNREAFYSLFKIGSSLHSIDEKICHFSLGWINRRELMLSPHNALSLIMSLKPDIVWVHVETSSIGKGTKIVTSLQGLP